ncbi:hypothetical protein PR202_gb27238 [Eleusine coracana subsp. coracana]|uniref:Aquaporin TIP4-3 n=1 Tax=Eleusine coracana subsp. coracana TaxID=191504 RepID=A0AAV5FUT8_ELECO|nr:hypothetical protein PR202_gb27238 [Eleusine coracana subsp. coracana]
MAKLALGHHREAADADCVRAVLAELILTFLFVFAGVGSAMATGRLAGGANSVAGLTAVALAHTLVVAVMISAGLHVSGGHINPAVTLGLAVTGRITLFRSALYVLAQLLGSALACFLLTFLAGGEPTPVHALASGVGAARGVAMEVVLTFSLLFAVSLLATSVRSMARKVMALGHRGEASEPDFLRGVLGELVLTFLFVFIGVGAAITAADDAGKTTTGGGGGDGELTAVALGQALVVAVIATAGFHISGGHVNPAVTLSLAVGGHITLFRSSLYILAQLLGSSAACVLLRWLTGGLAPPVHMLAHGVGLVQGVVTEIVFTFSLM